jgi:autotransporter translocation and assembly factor TamB
VLDRIVDIKGECSLRNDVVSFTSMQINTAESTLNANGTVDIAKDMLNLTVQLDTNEIADLTIPYYRGVSGRGDFLGTVTGGFDNPKLSGKAHMSDFSLESYAVDNFTATFSYVKNLLTVQEAVFFSPDEEHTVHGDVSFPEAKDLFDLDSPVYNLSVSIKNADFGRALHVVSKDTPAKGNLNADVKIDTKDKDFYISGHASVEHASVYDIPFDSVSLAFSYGKEELQIKHATIKNGKSVLSVLAKLSSARSRT